MLAGPAEDRWLAATRPGEISDDVHHCVAVALLKIANPGSVPGLSRALKSNTSALTVVRALVRIGNSDAASVLRWAALLRVETPSHARE